MPVPIFLIDPAIRGLYRRLNSFGIETCYCCSGYGQSISETNPEYLKNGAYTSKGLKEKNGIHYLVGNEHHPYSAPYVLMTLDDNSKYLAQLLGRVRINLLSGERKRLYKVQNLGRGVTNRYSKKDPLLWVNVSAERTLIEMPYSTLADEIKATSAIGLSQSHIDDLKRLWISKFDETVEKKLKQKNC